MAVHSTQSLVLNEDLDNEGSANRITKSNFHRYMLTYLQKPPESRTKEDIEILKACTINLKFFQSNQQIDPEDKLKSHYNGCKYLLYTRKKKGHLLFKHSQKSENFYIVLSGVLGVFIERPMDSFEQEVDIVRAIFERMSHSQKTSYSQYDIYLFASLQKAIKPYFFSPKGVKKYKEIDNMRVVYTDEYLEEIFGGLNNSHIDPEANIWSQKPESVSFQFLFFANFLEWSVQLHNDHYKIERADVWRAWSALRLSTKGNNHGP